MRFTSTLAETLAPDLLDRFLRYVRIDTQSRRDRTQSPSTPGQLDLSRLLVDELKAAGLTDATLDENGYVMATLPGEGETIGLIAHVDTSPDAPGAGVEPIVHRDHDGSPIALPRNGTVVAGAGRPRCRDLERRHPARRRRQGRRGRDHGRGRVPGRASGVPASEPAGLFHA